MSARGPAGLSVPVVPLMKMAAPYVRACVRTAVVQWHVTVVVGGGGAGGGGDGGRGGRGGGGPESDWRRSWTRPDGGATKVETIRQAIQNKHCAPSLSPSARLGLSLAVFSLIHNHIFFPLTYLAARGLLLLLLIHTYSSNKEVGEQTVWGGIYPAVIALEEIW